MIFPFFTNSKGGGDGDEEIRKIAYFSAFVDPALLKGPRDKTRVVKYKVPPKTAVQISDHILKTSRFVFGPELAVLQPHEEFMVFSLSGVTFPSSFFF
jgi:major vault protein